MAAFVLTLVPAAAFAAEVGGRDVEITSPNVIAEGGTATIELTVGETALSNTTSSRDEYGFWVVKDTEPENLGADKWSASIDGSALENTVANYDASSYGPAFWVRSAEAGKTVDVTVELDKAGTYTIYAGNYKDGGSNMDTWANFKNNNGKEIGKVTVKTTAALNWDQVSNLTSSFYTVDEDVATDKDTPVPVEFNFRDKSNVVLKDVDLSAGVAVWATEGGVLTDALVVKNGANQVTEPADSAVKNVYKVTDTKDLTVEFTRTGTYTLHAAMIPANAESVADFVDQFRYKEDQQVVEVVASAADIETVTLSGDEVTGADKTWSAELEKANGRETNTHTVTVLDADKVPVEGATFTVSANSTNVNLNGTSFTTDENGEFEFTYSADADANYKIYIKNAQYGTITLNVKAGDPKDATPDTIVANEKDVVLDATQAADSLANVVTFTITDTKGNVLTGDNGKIDSMMEKEPAVDTAANGRADYLELIDKPDNFRGKATNFSLIYDKDAKAYTLAYSGNPALVAGDYTVEVALDSGNSCQATFSLGDFNASAIESLQVVPTSDTVEYNTAGATVTYDVLAVDANGVSSDITNTLDWTLGLDFASVAGYKVTPDTTRGTLKVAFSDGTTAAEKEAVLGTEITITAASSEYGIAQGKVTVVDAGVVDSIEFDSTEGEVNKDNKVKASAVDADGNVLKNVEGKVFAYVADQSNQDAVVEVTPGQNAVDGVATITIFSDKETTVDVVVGIQKDKDNSPIYAGTLTYTIGAADVNADTLLGMTIGSTDYIVNNDVISGDAAPYIDENWRTMVPVRVLNETFGGTVDFKDNVITIVNGDTTVVMTIGEETYTVNDEEKTMDTAPVIRDNDRAYVPVRFMAEALGYTVTPLQAADGTTAGVVFQK